MTSAQVVALVGRVLVYLGAFSWVASMGWPTVTDPSGETDAVSFAQVDALLIAVLAVGVSDASIESVLHRRRVARSRTRPHRVERVWP